MVTAVIVGIAMFVLHKTQFGRHIFAMGGSMEAARRAGVPVNRNTVMIYVLSVYFGILPNSGDYVELTKNPTRNLEQMIFPAITLGFAFSASVMRTTRSAMLEVLGQDYIRTARSKGLREHTVVIRHALRNSLIPVVTLVGVEVGYLLGGAVIVEEIFALPGIGRLAYNAISQRDYALVQGVTLFIALNFLVINLIVDFIYTLLDPRISYAKHS